MRRDSGYAPAAVEALPDPGRGSGADVGVADDRIQTESSSEFERLTKELRGEYQVLGPAPDPEHARVVELRLRQPRPGAQGSVGRNRVPKAGFGVTGSA